MRNNLFDLARDPSCILAVTPHFGGSWWSPLRPNRPRNFAERPMTWSGFNEMQSSADWTHDYTFQCKFMIPNGGNGIIFAWPDMSSSMFGAYTTSNGSFYIYTNLVKSVSSSGKYTAYGTTFDANDYDVAHTIRIVVLGNSVAFYLDGVRVAFSASNLERTDKSTLSLLSPNSKTGYLDECSVVDDTTGELIWEAPYSDLLDNNPWPSTAPRNFAAEPADWYDAKTWFDNAPAGTMTFDFEFEQLSVPIAGKTSLFHNGGNSPFGCGWIIASADRFAFRINFYGLYDTGAIHAPYLQVILNASTVLGKHLVHAEASDGLFTVTMDGATVTSAEVGSRLTGSFTGVQKTSADCTIKRLSISVPGYRRFAYPSEAERVRLLTYENVRTDRGVFEQADTTNTCKIRTPFRTGGLTTSLSMLTRISVREQGLGYLFFRNSGNGLNILIASNRLSWEVRFADTQRTITVPRTVASSFWNGDHVVGMVLDRSKMTFSTIIDDTIESSVIMPEVASSQSPLLGLGYSGDIYTSGFADTKIAIKWHMVFDRALKPAEIAAISQC